MGQILKFVDGENSEVRRWDKFWILSMEWILELVDGTNY
jgi:hypothetical protein